ncbi:MAG TPA: hypothetical protein VMT30_08280 [Candidatus Saccharimonadia bacterium]|nr:hypothetical protein [Candidatus Saccharimonadia bacterium]
MPTYDIEKIKYATDPPTFQRAVELYEQSKIVDFTALADGFRATVLGTQPYRVVVSAKHFDHGSCECYLGRKDTLCKHLVAVAIMAAKNGQPLEKPEITPVSAPTPSGKIGELSEEDLAQTKQAVTAAMRHIKAYSGPSRTWFAYQGSLQEGCYRLSDIVSKLPISPQAAKLLVDILLRLDRKLMTGGVDDSDGTVGSFIEDTVIVLKHFVYLDPNCKSTLYRLTYRPTCFDWEVPLVELLNER